MRKTIQKKVVYSNISSARVTMEDGKPVAEELPIYQFTGNISEERAQKIIEKEHGNNATVFEIQKETVTYEMPIEQFIKNATIKEEN